MPITNHARKFFLVLTLAIFAMSFSTKVAQASTTGVLTATSNAADNTSAGDNNGFETTPTNTTTDNSAFASSANTGTNSAVDGCTTFNQSEDDSHDFYNFGIAPTSGSTINGIAVNLNGKWSTNTGTNQFCVGLSWDGGTTWTTAQGTGDLQTSEKATLLGSSSDTWGHTWTTTELNNTNFRLRVMIDPGGAITTTAYLDYLTVEVTYTLPATTTLGDGTNPSNTTLSPGDSITDLDDFVLSTDTGTDTVTAITVTLSPAGAFNNIAQVDITNTSNTTQCSATTNLASNTVNLTGCSLAITTTPTTFKVRITPKSHANMPPTSSGTTYAVTGTVTGYTSTNSQTGTDSGSATLTIDNTSPAGVTSSSGTSGIEQVPLAWTNPADSDYSQTIVLRRASSSISDTPVEGNSYSVGNTIGSSTVACVTSTTSCTDSGLTGGVSYHYKIFTKDSRGNYNSTGVVPTGSPVTPSALIISVTITTDGTISYGFVAPGSSKHTTSSDLNDTQTVQNDGNVAEDLTIKTTNALGGTLWSLGSSAGTDIFVHEFSLNGGGAWTKFTTANTYQSFLSNLGVSSTQNFDLRFTAPTSSTDLLQKNLTITILATQH